MSDIALELESGKTATFKTAGKVCKENIVVTATGGGGGDDISAYLQGTIVDFVSPEVDELRDYCFSYNTVENKVLKTADLRGVKTKIGSGAFRNCSALTSLIMPVAERFYFGSSSFANCKSLEIFESFSTAIITTANSYLWENCIQLRVLKVPNYVMSNVVHILRGCSALEEIYVGRITNNIQVGSGTTYGHLIKVECLVGLIQNLVISTTAKTLTIGTANMEKIAGLYCRITDDTTDTLTMELCEKTDEGAMTLEEYALEKGWQLA